ncbi:MAG: hypothetical protein ACJ75J_01735 [Cytophagaceae bacterium]
MNTMIANGIIGVLVLTLVYLILAGRLVTFIRVLSLQGFLLFGIVYFHLENKMDLPNFIFILVETILFKAILVPYYLNNLIRKNGLSYEREPDQPSFYRIFIVLIILTLTFLFGSRLHTDSLRVIYITAAFSTLLTGVLLAVKRTKLVTQIVGYLVVENGIFLLTLAVGHEMPVIINMIILFDVITTIWLFGIFVSKVNFVFKSIETTKLTSLKD